MQGILSIQSWVAYGHAGNAAAVFPLQRMGFEVWPVHTVQFSNHTGYGAWRGEVFSSDQIREILQGMAERGAFQDCMAILTGYTGDPGLGAVVMGTVEAVKKANPAAIWCCDPVMGDVGKGFFVKHGLPEYFRDHAMPAADIVTPNQFELEYLTGREIKSLGDAIDAVEALRARGPKIVLLTSLTRDAASADQIEMLAVEEGAAWLVSTPRLTVAANGAGDAVAALFLGNWLKSRNVGGALSATAAAIYEVIEATHMAGEHELQFIKAQTAFTEPLRIFEVRKVV